MYQTNKWINNFTSKINIDEAERDESNILENKVEFNIKSKLKVKEKKRKKEILLNNISAFYEGYLIT